MVSLGSLLVDRHGVTSTLACRSELRCDGSGHLQHRGGLSDFNEGRKCRCKGRSTAITASEPLKVGRQSFRY
jgi:hypothetical protein